MGIETAGNLKNHFTHTVATYVWKISEQEKLVN